MSASRGPAAGDDRHYSYAHYADRSVAEGFDALRFGGPIGQYLLQAQEGLLLEALSPVAGRRVLDVGTGTGRAAIGLAQHGASVVGVDASAEMLRVASARVRDVEPHVAFALADAHALPFADRSVDAAVSLRVLMHAIDWPRALGELCRVARWRVIVDFPALGSFAAVESAARRLGNVFGGRFEAYRVIAERDVRRVFAAHGYRVVTVRRQFVLPIAFHKRVGSRGFTERLEAGLASVGLLRLMGSPVTMVAER